MGKVYIDKNILFLTNCQGTKGVAKFLLTVYNFKNVNLIRNYDLIRNKKDLPFDMPHPSKKGWRLRHVCIEGPEIAVYCRGRVKNEKVIRFPSYWKDLVNLDSISVQLTPIGAHQNIIVKRWDDEFVYLQGQGGMPINCFYHIIAQRQDDDLIVEYEGESYEDYPGGNEGYSFNWESSNIERLIKEATHEKLKEMKEHALMCIVFFIVE